MSSREVLAAAREPYGRLIGYLRPYKGRFALGIFFGLLAGATNGGLVFVTRHVGNEVLSQRSAGPGPGAGGLKFPVVPDWVPLVPARYKKPVPVTPPADQVVVPAPAPAPAGAVAPVAGAPAVPAPAPVSAPAPASAPASAPISAPRPPARLPRSSFAVGLLQPGGGRAGDLARARIAAKEW